MNLNDKPDLTTTESKYLKADDTKEGFTAKVTIDRVDVDVFGEAETEKLVLFLKGKDKGIVLNKTNAVSCKNAWGVETDDWGAKELMLTTQFYPKFGNRGFIVTPIADAGAEFNDDIPF